MGKARFGDVIERIKNKVDRDSAGLEYYVGGEHIETDEVKISQKGKIAGSTIGPAFHMRFRKNDVLLMSRNPHLRKAAMVDFDGICSDVSYVCRPKDPTRLDPSYLPFIMRTDAFWKYAEEHKKGSTNFFLNWSDFVDYEFDLPPLARQLELADLLWAANDLKEAYRKLIAATDEMLKAKFREMFGESGVDDASRDGESQSKWPMRPLKDFGEIFTGNTPAMSNRSYYESNDICFVKPSDLSYDIADITSSEFYISKKAEQVARMYNPGAVLVTCIGATIGKLGIAKIRGTCNQQINFIMPHIKQVESVYLAFAIQSIQPKLSRTSASTTVPILSKSEFSKLTIPLPPLSLQREFVTIAEKADETKSSLKKSIADLDQVMKGLINESA